MASKNTSSSPNGLQKVQRSNSDSARWVVGLLLLFIGVFAASAVLFSFFTWAADQSGLLLLARGTCHAGRRAWTISAAVGGCQAGTPAGRQLVRRVRHSDPGDGGARRRARHPPAPAAVQPFDPLAFPHPDPRFADAGLRLLGQRGAFGSSTGWGGAFGIETAALLRTHIGVLGTLIAAAGLLDPYGGIHQPQFHRQGQPCGQRHGR